MVSYLEDPYVILALCFFHSESLIPDCVRKLRYEEPKSIHHSSVSVLPEHRMSQAGRDHSGSSAPTSLLMEGHSRMMPSWWIYQLFHSTQLPLLFIRTNGERLEKALMGVVVQMSVHTLEQGFHKPLFSQEGRWEINKIIQS